MDRVALCLSALCLATAVLAQTPDIFSYPTTEAAREAWEPQYGSPPVRVERDEDGAPCIVMEGDLKASGDRLCWDWVGSLDLSASDAVSLEVRADNAGVAQNLGIYFGSGEGWYPRFWWGGAPDTWTQRTFHFDEFGVEGQPAGWGSISRFRFSLWGNGPGHVVFRMRNFRAVAGDPNRNFLRNGSFEVPGPLPIAWGSGHWGVGNLPWVADMDLWRRHFSLDRAVARHGQASLRLLNPSGFPRLNAVSAWFTLPAARAEAYTLSAWLRSDRDGLPVTMTCAEREVTAKVGKEWQRIVLGGIPPGENHSVVIAPQESGTLWVDAVQVQRAGADTEEYHPHTDEGALIAREAAVDWSPPRRIPAVAAGRVTRGPLTAAPVSIDEHGRFLVGGQPYLMHSLGLEFVSDLKVLDLVAAAGFPDVCIEIRPGVSTDTLKSYFDRCAQLGMRIIPWLNSGLPMDLFRQHIETLRDHPALLCWYVYDEPSGEGFAIANEKLALAHELDPNHPALINYLASKLTEHMGDIYSTDIYPIPHSTPSAAIQGVAVMAEGASRERKPVWMWLQGTGYAYWMDREPTPRELSCMVYGSLIEGARGIYYFAQFPRTKEHWAEMRSLCVELKALEPVLGSLDRAPSVRCATPGVLTASFRYQGATWVLATNTRPEPCEAELRVSDGSRRAEVIFEDRVLPVAGNAWSDSFGVYERHVYRLRR